jgi:flagellar export protein FliJ
MKTAYSVLLEVREIEERQTEIALAEARRHHEASERELAFARALRDAWIREQLGSTDAARPAHRPEDATAALARLEAIELEAERRVTETGRAVDGARGALLECRRARQVAEMLHLQALEAVAREHARRAQAELDDLGALRLRARREDGDGS